ncbi:MAG: Uncharacterised protein [Prochlorococcus marinus str. MIT 9215]|nr:MAG: Uncharacterised protein [Prochlorococcus marinus str. MIT 9215]
MASCWIADVASRQPADAEQEWAGNDDLGGRFLMGALELHHSSSAHRQDQWLAVGVPGHCHPHHWLLTSPHSRSQRTHQTAQLPGGLCAHAQAAGHQSSLVGQARCRHALRRTCYCGHRTTAALYPHRGTRSLGRSQLDHSRNGENLRPTW